MYKKIAVLGAGMFGYVIANHIAKKNPQLVHLYDINKKLIEHLQKKKHHPIHFTELKMENNIVPTIDINEAVKDADIIFVAIPGQFVRSAIRDFKSCLKKGVYIVSLSKSLELDTDKRMSEIFEEELENLDYKFCVICGGMIAKSVAYDEPLVANIACKDFQVAVRIKKYFSTDKIRLYPTRDVIGVEYAAALKNVVAIAAGFVDGIYKQDEDDNVASSKSMVVIESGSEIKELIRKLGGEDYTVYFASPAWTGDLMTTCFGNSRNRLFGEMVAKSRNPKKVIDQLSKQNKTVEGYKTTKVAYDLARKYKVKSPVIDEIYEVLYKNKNPKIAIKDLMARPFGFIR
jgi:glycerol-3-phosphate dehydrogenase (NAD(P)+)